MVPAPLAWYSRIPVLVLAVVLGWGPAAGGRAAPPGPPAPRPYALTSWLPKDGLPTNRVRRIVQDSAGYLWVATFNGVARFDGVRFRHFDVTNTPALPNNLVDALYKDHAGRIWIGHETGEISVWERGQFRTLPIDAAWQGSPVDLFAETSDHTMLVLNRKGWIRSIRNLQLGPIINGPPAARPVFRYLVNDAAGHAWTVGETGIYRYHAATNSLSAVPDIAIDDPIRPHIFPARGGGIWVAGQAAVRRWKDGAWTGESIATHIRERTPTNTWVELSDGRLAACTLQQGLQIFSRDGTSQGLDTSTGLPANYVTTLLEDRQGNLWVGVGDKGLCRLRPSAVELVGPPQGWNNRAVEAVIEGRDGSIWAGTEGNGIFQLKEGRWTHFDRGAGLMFPAVKSLLEDRSGRIWAGTANGRIGYVEPGRFHPILTPAPMNSVAALFQDSTGRLWIGGIPTAMFLNGAESGMLPQPPGQFKRVNAFAETSDSVIWLASLGGGLGRYQHGALKVLGRADGLPSDYLWSIHASHDGTLWLGTYDRGLVRLRGSEFKTIDVSAGLPGNMVDQIVEDKHGALWLGTNGGIVRLLPQDIDRYLGGQTTRLPATIIDESAGLPAAGLVGGLQNTACCAADGTLWFATNAGLAHIDPAASTWTSSSHSAPPVLIEAVRIDGAEESITRGSLSAPIRVPAGSRRVEIDYTALDFSAPQRLRFQYRLEGADPTWTNAGAMRTAYFGYLRPGDYVFRVQVEPAGGTEQDIGEARLMLRVDPFFWETRWFAATAITAAVLSVGGIVYGVQQARHKRLLQKLAHEQAVSRDRTRIAHDLHDEIGSGLTQIAMLSHAALEAQHQPDKSAQRLREIQSTTTEMTEAIDEIVWAVNPRHDSLESLLTYLGRVVQEFTRRANLHCEIDIPLDVPPREVTAECRHELYLTLREALNNIGKHAAATVVRFSVRVEHEAYVFQLEDNGRGFAPDSSPPPEPRRQGLGLESMSQRMARLGSQFACRPRAGGGTIIELRVKIPSRPDPLIPGSPPHLAT